MNLPRRTTPLGAVALFLSLLFRSAAADAGRVSSLLQIHIPHNLTKTGGYEHKEALFGIPPYGGSIQQNVYYADSDLCDADVNTSKGYPTRDKDEKTGKMKPWPFPYILMVDRGYCTFVTKVRNAQRSGASGVIVADNTCVCADVGPKCTTEPGVDCETNEPIMADDGSGSDISIPSFLMTKPDADLIKAKLQSNQVVQMEMAWALPSPDNHVEYELWTTPTVRVGRKFLKEFKDAAMALGSQASFTPNMFIYDGTAAGCRDSTGANQCFNLCTNNGRYCATDPDNDLERGISGADVVKESLRRMCIWEHYGNKDGIGAQWWDYVNEFSYRCGSDADYFKSEDCVKDAMVHSGVDHGTINQCMSDSGGLGDANPNNRILEDQITKIHDRGIVVLPSAFVNGVPLRGALTLSVMFKAICAGYLEGTEPEVCAKCANCPDESACIKNGHCYPPGNAFGYAAVPPEEAVSYRTFKVSLFAVVAFLVGLGALYWKKQRDDMRGQVRDILAQYMLLDDGEAAAGRYVGGGAQRDVV